MHDPRLHIGCPPYASMFALGGSKVSSHSLLKCCCALWSGMMLQPAPILTSHSVLAMLEFGDCDIHSGSYVFHVFVVDVVHFCCCFEAFDGCLCSILLPDEEWCCVVLLTVFRLWFVFLICVYVFYFIFVLHRVCPTHVGKMS